MQQYEDIMQLLDDGSGSGTSLIDPFAGVRDILPMIIIWSLVISSVVILLWVITIISRFRAERAMVNIQKDMKAVRALLEDRFPDKPVAPVQAVTPPVVRPEQQEGDSEADHLNAQ